jgi:hypothetical protein
MLRDSARRHQLGEKAQRTFQERLTAYTMAQEYMRLYRQVIEKNE